MSLNNLLETSTVSMSDVIGNGKTYAVPPYQRDYSWKKDQWEDLWNDIIEVKNSGIVHYMGSIVLQHKGDKKYDVIDGQQRFTTLTLVVLATIKQLQNLVEKDIQKEDNKERINLLTKKFIGDKDPGSLTSLTKLKLNENNDSFFQTILVAFRPPADKKILQDSEKLLLEAYLYFEEKLKVYFESEEKGEIITNFLDKMVSEKLMFIQVVVENELSAYTVFETLNSRGIDLSVTDLLKNYLFSTASKVDMSHIKIKWKKVIDIIGLNDFPTFLRHYWISCHTMVRKEKLFKAVRNSATSSTDVIELLESLEKNAHLYKALSDSSDSFWEGDREIKKRIKELSLFKEKQAYSILMASYNNHSRDDFKKVLKLISVITFRYTVIGKLHTNLKEQVYSDVAVNISQKGLSNINRVAEELKPLYLSDKDFKNTFSTKEMSTKRGKKIIRYILFSIENHLSSNDYDFDDNPGTIEHILPENSDEYFVEYFPGSVHDSFVYRIGNYTILEDDKNRECGVKSFQEKQKIYKKSQYKLSSSIDYSSWTPQTIEKRQEALAKNASTVWRISQYDQ